MWYEQVWLWAKEHLTITVPGVVLIFAATFIVMLAVNAGEAGAAWVQAIGSIAALIGAAYLPILHSRQTEKRHEQMTLSQLRFIADDCHFKMWGLTNCFLLPDSQHRLMARYISLGQVADWASLEHAATHFPVERVPARFLSTLAALQEAVAQARVVCDLIPAWMEQGTHPEPLQVLWLRRDCLAAKLKKHDWLPGDDSIGEWKKRKLTAWQAAEQFTGPPLSISDSSHQSRVFIQFFGPASCPDWISLQVVFGDGRVVKVPVENNFTAHWDSREGAYAAATDIAYKMILAEDNEAF